MSHVNVLDSHGTGLFRTKLLSNIVRFNILLFRRRGEEGEREKVKNEREKERDTETREGEREQKKKGGRGMAERQSFCFVWFLNVPVNY